MTQQTTEPLPAPAPAGDSSPPSAPTVAIRVVAVVLGGALLVSGAASVVGYFMVRTSSEVATFTEPVTRVQVTGDTGDVRIRTGTAGRGATVTSRSTSAFRSAVHTERVSNGVLEVTGSCRGGTFIGDSCSVDFEILVPPGTAVDVNSSTGDIRVEGSAGTVATKSSSGDIDVRRAGGRITMQTNTGDITADDLNGGTVTALSDVGDIGLEFTAAPDRIRANTDTGDIQVEVPNDATAYQVIGDTSTGERTVSVPTSPTSQRIISASTAVGDVDVSGK